MRLRETSTLILKYKIIKKKKFEKAKLKTNPRALGKKMKAEELGYIIYLLKKSVHCWDNKIVDFT